jgi:hypothetical protein
MMVELKKTFTYASLPSVVRKARAKAAKEGYTLSELLDRYLREYTEPKKKTQANNK